jgi:hypothetical protein
MIPTSLWLVRYTPTTRHASIRLYISNEISRTPSQAVPRTVASVIVNLIVPSAETVPFVICVGQLSFPVAVKDPVVLFSLTEAIMKRAEYPSISRCPEYVLCKIGICATGGDDAPEFFGVELTLILAIIVFPHTVYIVPNKPSNAMTTAEVNHTFFCLLFVE